MRAITNEAQYAIESIWTHIVSISFGLASAVAADMVIRKYGRKNVILWFADTRWEDDDLYRFKSDCLDRWGGDVVLHQSNMKPPDVWCERQIIPNSQVTPCNEVLKFTPFFDWLKSVPFLQQIIVYLGMDWGDARRGRCDAPIARYESLPGVQVKYPLLDVPEFDLYREVQSWGIRPPRMYDLGFSHNNCGGRCPKQGQADWLRLRQHFPDRFEEMARWEEWAREQGGPRADRSFLKCRRGGQVKPITLREIVNRG